MACFIDTFLLVGENLSGEYPVSGLPCVLGLSLKFHPVGSLSLETCEVSAFNSKQVSLIFVHEIEELAFKLQFL